jgi:GntP family gluconate:H+ symporter
VGVVIALGAMLGKILADAGITEQIAEAILRHSSDRMIPWAMTLVAFIVGIPMFFEVGLVVMLPLIFSVARKLEGQARFKGSAYVYVGVPVISALAAMHGMVPPHPGPDRHRHPQDHGRPDHAVRLSGRHSGHGSRRPAVWRLHRPAHEHQARPGLAGPVHHHRESHCRPAAQHRPGRAGGPAARHSDADHAVAEMLLPKDAAAMHGQLPGQSR